MVGSYKTQAETPNWNQRRSFLRLYKNPATQKDAFPGSHPSYPTRKDDSLEFIISVSHSLTHRLSLIGEKLHSHLIITNSTLPPSYDLPFPHKLPHFLCFFFSFLKGRNQAHHDLRELRGRKREKGRNGHKTRSYLPRICQYSFTNVFLNIQIKRSNQVLQASSI